MSRLATLLVMLVACSPSEPAPSDAGSLAIRNVQITPNPAYNDAELTCEAEVVQQGQGQVSPTFTWSLDGEDVGEGPTLALSPLGARPEQELACTVRAEGADSQWVSRDTSLTIQNRTPRISSVAVNPSEADLGDEVHCEATATDPDGDDLALSYLWSNGVAEASFTLDDSNATPGTQLSCTATATDTFGASDTLVGIDRVQVKVVDPVVVLTLGEVTVTPISGRVGDALSCNATATASEGPPPTLDYAWSTGDSGESLTLAGASTIPGDPVTCTATATAAFAEPVSGTAQATVLNTPPVMNTVSVSPPEAHAGQSLTCTAEGSDADEEHLVYTYAWSNGQLGETLSLTPGNSSIGETLTCTATVIDLQGASDTGSASAAVVNGSPIFHSVTVSPSEARTGQSLTCAADVVDPEGEDLEIAYEWSTGETSPSITLQPETTNVGELVSCAVTATDPHGASTTQESAATVLNTPPEITSIFVSPSTPRHGDTVTCHAEAFDADLEELELSFVWSTGETTSAIVLSEAVDVGETLSCHVTATDPHGATDEASASATVSESPLSIELIRVDPVSARVGQSLTCTAEASHEFGEPFDVSFGWSNGDEGPSTLLTAANSNVGESVVCTVTVTAEDEDPITATAAATVLNTPPTMTSVTVEPTEAQVGQTVTCAATATDPDEETIEITYAWSTGESGESIVLQGDNSIVGEPVTCTATATDPHEATATGTAGVTVLNSPPSITSVTVDPPAAQVGETITCAATATDPDEEAVEITYAWSTGDEGESIVLQGENTDVGEPVTCTATATDPHEATGSDSASALVVNTPPHLTSVSVEPTSGQVGQGLTCAATATDPDEEELHFEYLWSTGETSASIQIAAETSTVGGTLTCDVTVSDPHEATDEGSAFATVLNTPPTMTSVTVEPTEAQVGQTVTCAATATDPDEETIEITYAWSTGESGESIVLQGDNSIVGEPVTCTATATDPHEATATGTAGVTVLNSPPSITSVTVDPPAAQVGETITCAATATDPDEEAVEITYAWSTGDEGESIVLQGENTDVGEPVTC
ncbi:MAG: hypothetical protein EA397_13140, partial [Deltaproteobacteria bacterium]